MNNIYNCIISANEDEFDFKNYLIKSGGYDIFKPVFECYGDINLSVRVIKFILYSYSKCSELLDEKGGTWEKSAKHIFSLLDIPSDIYDDVVNLRNVAVQSSIENWLEYQNDDYWSNYITFRNLRLQMIKHSLSDIKNSNDQLDIKSKMDAAKYAKDLLDMMDAAKNGFIQNEPKIKSSVEALRKAKTKDTLGPQNFAK